MTLANKMSDYLENKLLNHWLAGNSYTPPTNVYLAIGDAEANESDEDTWAGEFSGTGYQRQELSFHPARSLINGDTVSYVDEPIEFTAGGNWGIAEYFTIWDSQTDGKLLFRGQLRGLIDMTSSGKKLTILKEELAVVLRGFFSSYLRRELLDHVLRNETYSIPSKYVAITYTLPHPDQDGSQLTEPSDGNYGRVGKNDWTIVASSGTNDSDVTFPDAADDYDDLVRCCVLTDAMTNGNVLAFSMLELLAGGVGGQPPGIEILENDTPKIYSGNIPVTQW